MTHLRIQQWTLPLHYMLITKLIVYRSIRKLTIEYPEFFTPIEKYVITEEK